MFSDRRVLAVVNPASGVGGAEDLVEEIVPIVTRHGARDCEVRVTTGPDDASTWAHGAADEGFDLVIAAGGDGTVTAVATGVYRSGAPLPIAIVPLGTGNGLARVLGLPIEPRETLTALAAGRLVALDVIELTSHAKVSLLFFGAGLDATINREADGEQKERLGWMAYAKAALGSVGTVTNHDITLTLDGAVERLRGHTVSAFNATRMRVVGLELGPDAEPHDGVMRVAVMRSTNVLVSLAQMLKLMNRRASRTELTAVTSLELDARPPLPVQVDGDVVGETPLRARVVPAAVTFVADADYEDGGMSA